MRSLITLLIVISGTITLITSCGESSCKDQNVDLKIGFLGCPSYPDVIWNEENLLLMKDLGFNTMQLNIAWGYRPGDDPLNLEDVLHVPEKYKFDVDFDSTLNRNIGHSKTWIHDPNTIDKRANELKERSALCKKHGMHTIFHFGAPFVQYPAVEPLTQCIRDPKTVERYITLIKMFHEEFPDVDDLLMYTYDQNAWLCSEFGPCDKCNGITLDERATKFVNTIAQTWRELNPEGRLWWEPWEISAGQTYKMISKLDNSSVGLSIHSGIAEVQIALPADRWFRNILFLAEEYDIPVIAETWLGTPTEEVEPFLNLPSPVSTLNALRAINVSGKLAGIKEYYGNIPTQEDPNLRITSIFFKNPSISNEDALEELSKPYGNIAEQVAEYWKLSSQAIDLYPWDISWNSREVGKINPHHSMYAATLKGVIWETPSWQSNRRARFMRTKDTDTPHFWMLEDAQLRYEAAALKITAALNVADSIKEKVPEHFKEVFLNSIKELTQFRRNLYSYVYHIRATNLCNIMRDNIKNEGNIKPENIDELKAILISDMENQGTGKYMDHAINLLNESLHEFLQTYFLPKDESDADRVCIGCPDDEDETYIPQDAIWSVTSY